MAAAGAAVDRALGEVAQAQQHLQQVRARVLQQVRARVLPAAGLPAGVRQGLGETGQGLLLVLVEG